MKKKILVSLGFIMIVVIVGFQVVNDNLSMLQSPGAVIDGYQDIDYGLGSSYVDSLKQYPDVKKGERTPFNLWEYSGRGESSYDSPTLPMSWVPHQ